MVVVGGGLEVALGGCCNILKLGISFGEVIKMGMGIPIGFDPQGGLCVPWIVVSD